jgi:Tfp pilus assembly protein PilF
MNRIEKLNEFLKNNPGDSFLQHALALEYMKIEEYDKARLVFEQLLHGDPAYVGSYYHLAKLLEKLGDSKSAIGWYEKGMEAAKKAGDLHALGELRSAYEELMF